ncbi:MAG: prepilin-type N-terminal cleavage/methylation domain-containing protein [Oscillospiraceae bacterium]|nr:prepilin-type N-terminal cleavage/methylation domain-containing protein [Oscillospiraceae bacterium]
MKKNNKGFTLAELLIVVAIIAVLVAIAIPVFTAQLEKSKESTDAANIRSKYAEIVVKILEAPDTEIATGYSVELKQGQAGWQNSDAKTGLEGLAHTGDAVTGDMTIAYEGLDDVESGTSADFTYVPGTTTAAPTLTITIG